MNKTREQWQKVDAKHCAEHNSSAANFYLIRYAQQDIERLHRALADQSQSAHHNLLGELYQVLGALDAPDNVLDNVSAAIHDEPLPHATLLPFVVAAQSAPATVATGNMREVLAMVLQALDRDAAEGRGLRGEMAAELRAAMEAQSAGVPDVSSMARVLSDRSADACNIDRTDNWAMYGQEYIEDVQAMLTAQAQPAAQDQGEVQSRERWTVMCGHWQDTTLAIHGERTGHIASGIDEDAAHAIVNAHNQGLPPAPGRGCEVKK